MYKNKKEYELEIGSCISDFEFFMVLNKLERISYIDYPHDRDFILKMKILYFGFIFKN
jgi:hypothetical protein